MSALAQISVERFQQVEAERDYLRGQVDCLIGNPATSGSDAYLSGYGEAYAKLQQATASTEQIELPEGCF
jgi:ABC-type sulfate transport system substrate-binding protein